MTLIRIWGDKIGPWMQALHLLFGVGCVVTPFIAEPFLIESPVTTNITETELNNFSIPFSHDPLGTGLQQMTLKNQSQSGNFVKKTSEVWYAYVIIAVCSLLSVIYFGILYIKRKQLEISLAAKIDKSNTDTTEEREHHAAKWMSVVYVCFAASFNCMYGLCRMYPNFLMVYSVNYLGWDKLESVNTIAIYVAAFLAMQIAGVLVIKRIRPSFLLIIYTLLAAASILPLFFLAKTHHLVLKICTASFGVGSATMLPTNMTYAQRHIHVTGSMGAALMMGTALGFVIGPLLLGILISKFGEVSFVYILQIACVMNCMILIGLFLIAKRIRDTKLQNVSSEVLEQLRN